jgi:hypothetical protein
MQMFVASWQIKNFLTVAELKLLLFRLSSSDYSAYLICKNIFLFINHIYLGKFIDLAMFFFVYIGNALAV